MKPKGTVIYITGRPASGKSTLARELVSAFDARGTAHLWLDSDDLRGVLTPRADFTDQERSLFYEALGHIAVLGARGGVVTVISATASRRAYRDRVREAVPRFIEVYLECEEAVLFARDPKGLYQAARQGRVVNLPGLGAPYEEPQAPELALDSGRRSPEELAGAVLRHFDAGDATAEP